MGQGSKVPTIDLQPFLEGDDPAVSIEIGKACAEFGFFCVSNHGISDDLQSRMEDLSRRFFALPLKEKMNIAMAKGGRAWRGYFPVGGELTSGRPDLKEGLYFGEELAPSDPRVVKGWALHGPNLFPENPPDFKTTALEYMAAMTKLGHRLMEALSLSLDLDRHYFRDHFTHTPTPLFRIFHYPPHPSSNQGDVWGVGEHTDYGLLTILQQDQHGGLEVKTPTGWIPVPPQPGVFVCNAGDMLDFLTSGRYRSVPHRVKNLSGQSRLSFPFFFDPGFDAAIATVPSSGPPQTTRPRWDGEDLYAFRGTYGDYLIRKVSKVFPELARTKI